MSWITRNLFKFWNKAIQLNVDLNLAISVLDRAGKIE